MSSRRILVPVDFTPCSDEALKTAATLARGSDSGLLIVHIVEPPILMEHPECFNGAPSELMKEFQQMLDKIAASVEGLPREQRLLEGPAADAILDLAETEQVDWIVLGTHGRCGTGRLGMGRVAEAVVRRAQCPVLVVKAAASQAAMLAPASGNY
ncbi:MAG: universal stress protein [Planctomycetia bacterium]|nr:universal stress protein [Planctomycetia bacterium]